MGPRGHGRRVAHAGRHQGPVPRGRFLAGNRVVFNVKGNRYRMDTRVAYRTGVVVVKRIGTHAEYDRWTTFND